MPPKRDMGPGQPGDTVRSHQLHDLDKGDVVELPVVESYRTLNLKALVMLSWAEKRLLGEFLRFAGLLSTLNPEPSWWWGCNFTLHPKPETLKGHGGGGVGPTVGILRAVRQGSTLESTPP